MVRRGTPGPTPRRRTHGGVHGSRGTEIMAARWVFCFSDGHYWGCMMRDEQRGQLSKHPPLRFPLGAGGTSDPSAPKQVMASSSGKGRCPIHMYLCFPGVMIYENRCPWPSQAPNNGPHIIP